MSSIGFFCFFLITFIQCLKLFKGHDTEKAGIRDLYSSGLNQSGKLAQVITSSFMWTLQSLDSRMKSLDIRGQLHSTWIWLVLLIDESFCCNLRSQVCCSITWISMESKNKMLDHIDYQQKWVLALEHDEVQCLYHHKTNKTNSHFRSPIKCFRLRKLWNDQHSSESDQFSTIPTCLYQ